LKGGKFTRNDSPQRRQRELHRVPHQLGGDILVVMAIDIAGPGYVFPSNGGVPYFYLVREATGRF
jgi:hypothetical protein